MSTDVSRCKKLLLHDCVQDVLCLLPRHQAHDSQGGHEGEGHRRIVSVLSHRVD